MSVQKYIILQFWSVLVAFPVWVWKLATRGGFRGLPAALDLTWAGSTRGASAATHQQWWPVQDGPGCPAAPPSVAALSLPWGHLSKAWGWSSGLCVPCEPLPRAWGIGGAAFHVLSPTAE